MNAQQIKEILLSFSADEKSKVLSRFFKTSKGAYGEGDCFIGVPVPIIRSIAKRYRKEVSLSEAEVLLDESIHECRMLGLLLMVALFEQSDNQTKKAIFDSYLLHTYAINNWDLVDLTAYQIVGRYLIDKDRSILYSLAKSDNFWEQRIAIVSTWLYIREGQFRDTLEIADILLQHEQDLIRKAVGWMLREVGKRNKKILIDYLEQRAHIMPRTMLRYSIEKFSPEERSYFMKK